MQQSGTRLVVGLAIMALLAGGTSWWYRYEAAHRATQFWGAEASRLIAESEGFEVWYPWPDPSAHVFSALSATKKELSRARGQAHLRHALMSDRNYVWGASVDPATVEWGWQLHFYEEELHAWVLLSEDLKVVGKRDRSTGEVAAFSCEPMAASVRQYFEAVGLVVKSEAKPAAAGASTEGE